MEKTRNSSLWTEVGYELFASEGLEGIQVERLARILNLNKSGFYHYFGNLEVFISELLSLHEKKAEVFFEDIRNVKNIDPDYLQMVVKHKVPIMCQIQFIRIKNNSAFAKVVETIDKKEDYLLREVWSDYIGFQDKPDLAIRYFNIVRDMLHARMSMQNINHDFLRNVMAEAKELMQQIVRQFTFETIESYR
jgi:AcrR family transcriptional regulator